MAEEKVSSVDLATSLPDIHLMPEFADLAMATAQDAVDAGLKHANLKLWVPGRQQLQENLIIGEDEAVEATLMAMLIGGNVLYLSLHGGAKTQVLTDSHRLVGGITSVANIPPVADLTGSEVTGKAMPLEQVEKDPENEDREISRKILSYIFKGIVSEETQVLNVNEFFRMNPFVQNAILEVTAARKLVTSTETMKLDRLEWVNGTANPFSAASRQNQFRPHTAAISRFQAGVVMGHPKYWNAIGDKITFENYEATPENMKPVISLAELHLARLAIKYGIVMPQSSGDFMKKASMATSLVLAQHGGEELPGRINVHIRDMAKAFAALKGESSVKESDVRTALGLKVAALMSGLRPDSSVEIDDTIKVILETADKLNLANLSQMQLER